MAPCEDSYDLFSLALISVVLVSWAHYYNRPVIIIYRINNCNDVCTCTLLFHRRVWSRIESLSIVSVYKSCSLNCSIACTLIGFRSFLPRILYCIGGNSSSGNNNSIHQVHTIYTKSLILLPLPPHLQ